MQIFLWGALAALSLVCGLFFLRFWRLQRERLFLVFALAFAMLALNWTLLAIAQPVREATHPAYLVRLVAFLLILAGMLDANRRD
jgi:hypothetical protein